MEMEKLMSFEKSSDCDEFSGYEKETFSAEMESDIKTKNGEIRFWIRGQIKYPSLHKTALWFFVAPVSSMSSERDFSFINCLVSADRACLQDYIIEDNAFLKSFFEFSKRLKNQSGWWN